MVPVLPEPKLKLAAVVVRIPFTYIVSVVPVLTHAKCDHVLSGTALVDAVAPVLYAQVPEPDTQSIKPEVVKLHLILIAELYVPMLKIIGATAYDSGYTQHSNVQFADEVGVILALAGVDNQLPAPAKYNEAPFVAAEYEVAGSNGDIGRIANVVDAGVAIVCVRLLPELSINLLFCNVSMLVFAIAVRGDDGGVKLAE